VKPRRGRPKIKPQDKREMFAIRLTAAERAVIERAAKQAELRVSDWARAVLVAHAGT
jgi:uncharacterized protein (DUF1778 family)